MPRPLALLLSLSVALAPTVPAMAADPQSGVRVAVMTFDNASGDPAHAPLGTGIQAMLTTDLAEVAAFTLIERQRLAEIQVELALADTGAIDPATAAKVGALAGASHLIAGAITVHGDAMRIDARMFDVTTGKIVLTAAIEGEKEAFFELEKQLVQKIVLATQTKLTPKERAEIARIHTADYKAFERFSAGLHAFDRKAYDEAMAALREAAAMDAEFTLARLTLDDYQGIIAKLEARADLIVASERKARALAANARAKAQQVIIDRLWELSRGKGAERAAALFQLAMIHGDIDGTTKREVELHQFEDHFALERLADQLCKTYFAEAVKLWPRVPLYIDADYGFNVPIDTEQGPDKLEAESKRWLEEFFGTGPRTETWQHHRELLDNLDRHRRFAARLHLDAVGHARMVERAYKLAMTIDPDAIDAKAGSRPRSWRRSMNDTLGGLFREAGLLDESTKYYAEAGRLSDEPWAVTGAAREVERNKEAAAFFAAHPHPLVREWLLARRMDIAGADKWWRDEVVKGLSQAKPTPRALSALVSGRELRNGGDWRYVLVGEHPVFPIESAIFQTGPRSDPRRATSFNYYRGKTKSASEEPWLAIVDARRSKAVEATFDLRFVPHADWWHESLSSSKPDLAAAGFVSARPEVVFIFGVEDIDVEPVPDQEDQRARRMQRGLGGFGVKIDGSSAAIVEVTEPEVRSGLSIERHRLQYKVLADASVGIGDHVGIKVKVDGTKVSVRVGRTELAATLPRVAEGFVGFAFLRPGFVSVDKLAVTFDSR